MKLILNTNEYNEYCEMRKNIEKLPPGHYYVRDFCSNGVPSGRLSRKLFEDVIKGTYSRISLVNTLSKDGYVIS